MKNKIQKGLMITLIICSCITSMMAQTKGQKTLSDYIQSEELKGWINFTDDNPINATSIFDTYKSEFGLSADDEMRITKTETDNLGFTHFRYQQYYKNLKVMYAEYIVHQSAEDKVKSANGVLVKGLGLSNKNSVNEQQALTSALQFVNAKKYMWQNEVAEAQLKKERKDNTATYYPKGELVITPDHFDNLFDASSFHLAWAFDIYTNDTEVPSKKVFVDAATGRIILSVTTEPTCFTGTANTTFNGSKAISTTLFPGIGYGSINDCSPPFLYVYNCGGGSAPNTTIYRDQDNVWTDQSASQCMYGTERTTVYYYNIHGRNSWDNANSNMVAYNNANAGQNNAAWSPSLNAPAFYAGSTNNANDDWNTLDIVGHEFTHGVTQSSANLIYEKEPGALNESFSDIFGEMVESFSTGSADWLVGANRATGAIRSFSNPSANPYNDPDTYQGTYWTSTSGCTPVIGNDYCGVHNNSGVQNLCFYLLSEGGSGTNDFATNYTVSGIGRFKARDIAYRALTVYLNSTSQFINARAAWIHAAIDLYGSCSNEAIQTGLAWRAVGVGDQLFFLHTKYTCGNYPANGTFVQAIENVIAASTCTNTITASSSTVTFTASQNVILEPGFTALNGSNFIAYIEPCSITMYRTGSDMMSDAERNGGGQTILNSFSSPSLISVFPNPASDFITVQINNSDSETNFKIYNSTMQLVRALNAESGIENKIATSDLSPGIYFLIATTENETYKNKFVIAH